MLWATNPTSVERCALCLVFCLSKKGSVCQKKKKRRSSGKTWLKEKRNDADSCCCSSVGLVYDLIILKCYKMHKVCFQSNGICAELWNTLKTQIINYDMQGINVIHVIKLVCLKSVSKCL